MNTAIINKYRNCITPGSNQAVLVGGSCNTIGNRVNGFPSPFSGIGGGFANCINAGGTPAQLSCFNVVAGGQSNTIAPGVCHSSILGGFGNTVNHNYASVAGCNITSAANTAMHANNFVAQNIPAGNPITCAPPLGAPTGSFYFVIVPPAGFRQLWIA